MPSFVIAALLAPPAIALAVLGLFLIYLVVRYTPDILRVFEEKPLFMPLRIAPSGEGEPVAFQTTDGLALAGTYWKARTRGRAGVVVFCHEFLGDHWSALAYSDGLRDLGFDLFGYDSRNHGRSAVDPKYHPVQWVTEHDLRDLRAALDYLRSRPDRDPAGVALYGISRGGGVALCAAAEDPRVWAVVSDGAFPIRGTMLSYILRWAKIFILTNERFYMNLPVWIFEFVGWVARRKVQRWLGCRFADVEAAVVQLAPRPWLQIHGQKDAYIPEQIARDLHHRAGDPKELWVVPGAKHNRSRERDPEGYAARLSSFLGRYAPRRLADPVAPAMGEVPAPETTVNVNVTATTTNSLPLAPAEPVATAVAATPLAATVSG